MKHKHLLTISGLPKSGTSTLASRLTEQYDIAYLNGGDVFRALADQRDMSLTEFSKYANEHPEVDERIDDALEQLSKAFVEGNTTEPTDLPAVDIDWDAPTLLLESRLAGWLTEDYANLNLWVIAPFETRVDRAFENQDELDKETVRRQIAEREADEATRYREQYDIDIYSWDPYDSVLNTGDRSVEETLALLKYLAKQNDPEMLVKKPKQTNTKPF